MQDIVISISPLWIIAGAYLFIVNLVAFCFMWRDKHLAKKENARRIPEKTLFLSALLGGSIGAIAGMYRFRHKTRHWYFVIGMPAILIAQIALVIFAFYLKNRIVF